MNEISTRMLKGPPRRGIGWVIEDWPDLNKKLELVKEFLNARRIVGTRKLSSAEVLSHLLDFYISSNRIVVN